MLLINTDTNTAVRVSDNIMYKQIVHNTIHTHDLQSDNIPDIGIVSTVYCIIHSMYRMRRMGTKVKDTTTFLTPQA